MFGRLEEKSYICGRINNQIVHVSVVLPQKVYRTITDHRDQKIDQILS